MLTSLLSILSCNIDSYADDSSVFLSDIQTLLVVAFIFHMEPTFKIRQLSLLF